MATAEDRRALKRHPQERLRYSWLALTGFVLVLVLLAVALVQARQATLLRQVVQGGDDYVVLMVYQAETEQLRLRDQWQRAADDRVPLDADMLRLRYEIWVSRIELLRGADLQHLLSGADGDQRTLQQAMDFIQASDRALGPTPEVPLDRAFVRALLPQLEALTAPMHELSLGASHKVSEQLEARGIAVRQQSQLGLGLTAFLSVLTLAFAFIALRQVAQLRERRLVLEELATKLRVARREAEAASDAKSAFLANMSHEIRTPFHGLMGMLSLLRETGLTPRQIDYLRTATESADHLLALLNDILDMSQLESGRVTLAVAPVDLRALLRDVEALMRPQATAKPLALHIDAAPGVPERMLADATRLKQILFNLLSNAIKFTDHGAVVLDVRTRERENGEPCIEFAVTDTGVGMDEATLAQLFSRFVQGDSTRSRRHGGTGLGLEISRNLARLMGGDITVRSRPGEGSCFTFHMPLRTPPRTASEGAAPLLPIGLPASRPLHVLVAEDHPVNRQYMAALLENLGHHAHFTSNGQEAVEALCRRRYDVVLMDLHMPVLDGVSATRAIRALPDAARSTVPIVALTADAFAETRDRCLVAGMNDFLTKPVSVQKLATSLRRLFGSGTATPDDVPVPPDQAPAWASSHPVVDESAVAMALQAMSRDKLAAMVEAFLDHAPETVQRLRAAVRDAQPLDLRINAHAAKGAALNLGLAGLAATAEALHEGAAHLPAHEIARLVQRYEDLVPATRKAMCDLGVLLAAPQPAVTG